MPARVLLSLAAMTLLGCDGGADAASPDETNPAYLFQDDLLHTYELELSETNLAFLDADPRAEVYVEGALVFEGKRYEPVGIRYKGSIGAFRNCLDGPSVFTPMGAKACTKLSMKVKFNWDDPEGRFFGLKKLQLHSLNRDPSAMRERLAYKMFRDMGVAAPRAVHARVLVNGDYVGVFANVEQVDGRFTRSAFEQEGGKGNLYKEVWPVTSDGLTQTEDELRLGLKTNENDMPPLTAMLGLGGEVATAADEASAAAAVERWVDRDVLMRTVAVDRVIRADDGPFHFYCGGGGGGCSNHNYFWYEALAGDQLWLIPWDMDGSLGRSDGTIVPILVDWLDREHGCEPFTGANVRVPQRAPACDPLIRAWGEYAPDFERHVQALVEGPFSEASVAADIDRWSVQIRPSMVEAAQAHADAPTASQWDAAVQELLDIAAELRMQGGRVR